MININGNILVTVYLGLGTNLGDKKKNIEVALRKIEKQIGEIISLSAFYVSEPFGFDSDNLFLNCAVEIKTTLSPYKLLANTQLIELLILIFCSMAIQSFTMLQHSLFHTHRFSNAILF